MVLHSSISPSRFIQSLHAVEAKVNGRATPLKTILKAGDVVEIITSPDIMPNRSWLKMVFTPTARHHLKHWLNLQ
ncbi:TGS domain-containing protein, partial [Acidobacteriota bacterium]